MIEKEQFIKSIFYTNIENVFVQIKYKINLKT